MAGSPGLRGRCSGGAVERWWDLGLGRHDGHHRGGLALRAPRPGLWAALQERARDADVAEGAVVELEEPATGDLHRAALARALQRPSDANRELREAHRLYTEMGATGHAERLARELGL